MRALPILLLLVACSGEPERLDSVQDPVDPEASAALREAVAAWRDFAPVDAPMRIAPEDCWLPPNPVMRRSAAGGEAGHARKLYTLRARDVPAYRAGGVAPVGQVLVKESFRPRPAGADEAALPTPLGGQEVHPFAAWNGRVWTAGEPGPLLVMAKLDPSTPGTDQGWIYGGVTRAGEVLAAGRVADCMECHQGSGTTDRQFGLADVPWSRRAVLEVALEQGGVEPEWIRQARFAAQTYEGWGRVDDLARWAPGLCRVPPPPRARRSASADGDTHGRKLYSLFAKDHDAYVDEDRARAPVGQVLVKQAWVPVEIDPADLPPGFPNSPARETRAGPVDGWLPFARGEDGRAWRAAQRGPLFVMMKRTADAPGTDQGWIYATVAPSGVVTAAGAVASCIDCHEDAPRDRQFGLPPD